MRREVWLIVSAPLVIDNITIHHSSFVVHSANNRELHLCSDFYFTRYSHACFSTNYHHKLGRCQDRDSFLCEDFQGILWAVWVTILVDIPRSDSQFLPGLWQESLSNDVELYAADGLVLL